MWWHTTRRSFGEGAFFNGDEEKWTAYVNEGLVFAVAKAAKLWSDGQFLFSHIVDTQVFQAGPALSPEAIEFRAAVRDLHAGIPCDRHGKFPSRSEVAVLSHGQEE
jgi:hypothetical protein